MKRNLSLLLVSLLLAGTALAQEHNPGSVQPGKLSGNNALHEQTMAR